MAAPWTGSRDSCGIPSVYLAGTACAYGIALLSVTSLATISKASGLWCRGWGHSRAFSPLGSPRRPGCWEQRWISSWDCLNSGSLEEAGEPCRDLNCPTCVFQALMSVPSQLWVEGRHVNVIVQFTYMGTVRLLSECECW